MVMNASLGELNAAWQPFEESFDSLRSEMRQLEHLASSLASELEISQQELLRRAYSLESLQCELARQRTENIRLLSKCEDHELKLQRELAELRTLVRSAVQPRSEVGSEIYF